MQRPSSPRAPIDEIDHLELLIRQATRDEYRLASFEAPDRFPAMGHVPRRDRVGVRFAHNRPMSTVTSDPWSHDR